MHARRIVNALTIAMALAAVARPQTPAAPASFAAVSIKKFQRTRTTVFPKNGFQTDPAGVHAFARSLKALICSAYGIAPYQLTGGDPWTAREQFNLDAATAAPATNEQLMTMLRGVLADRFGLKLQKQTKATPALALVVAAGGLKLRTLAPDEPEPRHVINLNGGTMRLPWQTMHDLTMFLNNSSQVAFGGRVVIDRTGLTGRYDSDAGLPFTTSQVNGRFTLRPNFLELPAVLKKVGLELKPTTVPWTTFTIESAHEPTAN